ncbi:MAG: hypothetical protein U9Q73_02050, partial [Nanoarchaeota archaeon]|nr:hypothetical protein [Nanoarchaeota archaeon]
KDVLDVLGKNLKVETNSSKQKIVFNYEDKIAVELEVRKSAGKYPSMLLITNKKKILKILLDNISERFEVKRNLIVYGTDCEKFKI